MRVGDPILGDSRLYTAKLTKIGFIRRWRSLPRFIKLYLVFAMAAVMLFLAIIALTGISPFASSADTVQVENDPLPERVVSLDQPLIDIQQEKPLQKPNPIHTDEKKQVDDELFHFDGSNELTEIAYERDLLRAVHTKQQLEVIDAMKHSWNAYRDHAWGADHLRPITFGKQNWFNVGLTILDSLDTLIVMGLDDEFKTALEWVEETLTFDIHKDVNCFEMTIRVLGGLESAFHLTKKPVFLAKAVDVGDRLIHCFDSPSGLVPYSDVNLKTRTPKSPGWSPDSSLSEVSTVQLEFRDLSRLVKEAKFEETSFKTSLHLHSLAAGEGHLLPMYINPTTGQLTPSTITMGARGDSYYEYLLKQYLQTGIDWLQEDYLDAVDAIKSRLIQTTMGPKKLVYIAELQRKSTVFHPKMDHLVCFLPGTLALGHYHFMKNGVSHRGHLQIDGTANSHKWSERFSDHLQLAEDLARTCYEMYNFTATGLSPEIVYFGVTEEEEEIYVRPADTHNLLRPEYVESLFYLYHITGKEMYREQGYRILESFNKYCRVATGGYTTIDDVRSPENPRPKNMQESFWTAETLKYLFLLFSEDKNLIRKILDHYIMNTEAHFIPMRV
ncbi:Endoplasmic reticulum mannosyl-oligosaccharide 1,2-alpha-mannosidase [Halotydeus destructor]|nr:Endoplasmic reticulum mannosyl-oligosaccharide 1,2-alpha-mannosidase [Halotydeus destructor]